jgi:hypothetical protein
MTHDKLAAVAMILTAWSAPAIAAPPNEDAIEPATECPDAVRGVDLAVRKLDGGVTLEFTTKQRGQVGELRLLLRDLANIVEHHSKLIALHPDLVEDSSYMVSVPAVDIDVRDTATGARVFVRPENPGEVGTVRAEADALRDMWNKSSCVKGAGAGTFVKT